MSSKNLIKDLVLDPLDHIAQGQEEEDGRNENIHRNNKIPEKISTIGTIGKKQKKNQENLRLYGFYLSKNLADKLSKYCFWLQKTKSESIRELLVLAFKTVEKDEPLLEIPPDKNFRKVLKEVKENINIREKHEQSGKQEPAIK